MNVGSYASTGTFAGGPNYGLGVPRRQSDGTTIVGGGYAGIGTGPYLTNANTVSDLGGVFNTYSFNLGVGPKVSFQFGISSNGTWIVSASMGPGVGASGSSYLTDTTPLLQKKIKQ